VLGCEGGSNLFDPDGTITRKVDEYQVKHPDANFEEVAEACFPGKDGNLNLYAISPRHFEACLTHTCQALVEGRYNDILTPGIHYIEIKKDWSNIAEVLGKIQDVAYCEHIAENADRDIVASGRYTYRKYVEMVLTHVNQVSQVSDDRDTHIFYLTLIDLREKFPLCFSPLKYTSSFVKYKLYRLLTKLNLYGKYQVVKARIVKRK
jgi:hypothetical protein